MLLKTTRFGEMEVNLEDCFEFSEGILGFTEEKKFVVLDGPDDCPLKWLQSIANPDLAFVIMDPTMKFRTTPMTIIRLAILSTKFKKK